MGEESFPPLSDRALEQAIVALKNGAHLLKYGKRGKPKFCPFKLSMDERYLIWYSGQEEKKLRLSTVTNIIQGQNTTQLQLEKESQCLSLIYANGKCSLELICKDKMQAESWFIGLSAVVYRNYRNGITESLKKQRGAQSCINSPAAFMRRKQILGLSEYKTRSSEVHSLSGSPPSSFSCSSDNFSSASNTKNAENIFSPNSPLIHKDDTDKRGACASISSLQDMHVLKDIYIWGEGAGGGYLGGGETQAGALVPKLLESTMMLVVQTISLGRKHAALVTKQGEVFCWGEAKRGRLGHKVDIDSLCPKIVDSLAGVHVKSVSCGEYQTCAVSVSGELYMWGDNYMSNVSGDSKSHWLPQRVSGTLDGVSISTVSCGEWHTAIVSESGLLFTYGDGTFGALGHGDLRSHSHPKEVESIKGLRVKTVACGPWHTAAIVEITVDCGNFSETGGKLFTWGDSDKGRLGHPDQERKLLPTCVAELSDHNFVQVSCGDALTAGLTKTGRVYTVGSAAHGQLGAPQARDKSIVAVKGRLVDEFVVEISSGSFHVAVLTLKGNVYTWGRGENGQLGLGDTKDRSSPSLVDALRGRKVEKVMCGSSSSAAICVHKSLSNVDQLSCGGCGNAFGFTRKKHNCYNCGRLFCRSCCNKRSMSASLAPNTNKAFRVCNPCFSKLQSVSCPVFVSKLDGDTPKHAETRSIRKYYSSYDGDRSSERKDYKIPEEKPQPQELRWGQVSCPRNFMNKYRDSIVGLTRVLGSSGFRVRLLDGTTDVKSIAAAPLHSEKESDRLKKQLSEEISNLKAQVDSLEKQCQTRRGKIQENQQRIEEAQSLAKEEAAKCKEANEIIYALTSKLYEISGKISTRKDAEEKTSTRFPQTRTHPVLTVASKPTNAAQINDSNTDNLCSSPVVFSSKLRSLCNDLRLSIGGTDSGKTGSKCTKVEWMDKYQPGVFLTFTSLPDGKTGIRRVRFSRNKFNEREAKRWWEENQQTVCRNYGIDGCSI